MKQLQKVNCNICDENKTLKLYTTKSTTKFAYPKPLTYVKCTNCGLIYTNPRPQQEEVETQYESEEYRPSLPPNAGALKQILLNGIHRLKFIEKHSLGKNLLDIGCAQGNFIYVARALGWEVTGIEVSKRYSQIAQEKFKLNVITGTLEQAKLQPKYDVITCFDVIEHLPNPLQFLQNCKDLLQKEGIIIAETCNAASLHQMILGKKWQGDPGQHLYLFTPKTLKKIAQKAGYKVIKIAHRTGWEPIYHKNRGESIIHYIAGIIVRLTSKILHKESMIVLVAQKP